MEQKSGYRAKAREQTRLTTAVETAWLAVGSFCHVLAAVAHDLVKLGYAVLWTPTAHLIQPRLAAKRDLRLPHELAKVHRYACLVLDDIGYAQVRRFGVR